MMTTTESLKHQVKRAKEDLRTDLNANTRRYCETVISRGTEALKILAAGGSECEAMYYFQVGDN